MKTYLQMDGDRLVEYVEKCEYDVVVLDFHDMMNLLDLEKSTRNHMIKRGAELERELDDLKSQRADFGVLVDKMDRELDAAKAKLKEAYDDLLNIATMPEYDRDDCHRLRNLGMRGASNLQAFIK